MTKLLCPPTSRVLGQADIEGGGNMRGQWCRELVTSVSRGKDPESQVKILMKCQANQKLYSCSN